MMRVEERKNTHILRNEPNILTSKKEIEFEYFFTIELLIFDQY